MALDAWLYGNPETVAIRRQEAELRKLRECGSCKHHVSAVFDGETLHRCAVKRFGFGQRCEQFKTKGNL